MSETRAARSRLIGYCVPPIGADMGYGGDKIVPHAWAFDLPRPYTQVGEDRQQLRGDARFMPFLCDDALDWIYSSHLVEDFVYAEQVQMIAEWRRVLKPGGNLIILCPDEQVYSKHCRETGQDYNLAHKERDFSLASFKVYVLDQTGPWEVVDECPLLNTYSWYLVAKKA